MFGKNSSLGVGLGVSLEQCLAVGVVAIKERIFGIECMCRHSVGTSRQRLDTVLGV